MSNPIVQCTLRHTIDMKMQTSFEVDGCCFSSLSTGLGWRLGAEASPESRPGAAPRWASFELSSTQKSAFIHAFAVANL